MPIECRAMPRVTGPVSCSLIGSAATGDGTEEGPQAHEGLPEDAGVGERRPWVDGRVVDLERPVGQHGDAARCPTQPGRPSAPCRSGSAATARPAGAGVARARTWPRRARQCAAGCRSRWPALGPDRSSSSLSRRANVCVSHSSPWLLRLRNSHQRGAWANLIAAMQLLTWPLACPSHVGAAPACGGSGPRRCAGRQHPRRRAHRRRPRLGHVGGGAGRRAHPPPAEPHGAADRRAGWARRGQLGRARGRPRARPISSPWRGPRSPWWRRSRRRRATRSSTARPTATSDACRCASPGRCCSVRCRWRGSRPWRHRSAPRCWSRRGSGWPVRLLAVVGVPAAAIASRALHGLARRWVVFVPAGLVLHDLHAMVDPVLFPRSSIRRLGPAPTDPGDAVDLTQRALGLALELELVGASGDRTAPPRPHAAGRARATPPVRAHPPRRRPHARRPAAASPSADPAQPPTSCGTSFRSSEQRAARTRRARARRFRGGVPAGAVRRARPRHPAAASLCLDLRRGQATWPAPTTSSPS